MVKFSKGVTEYGKRVATNIAENPVGLAGLGISAAALKVSSDNRRNNQRMRKESDLYNRKQIEVMNRLTNTLAEVDTTLHNENLRAQLAESNKKSRKRSFLPFFRQKDYSESLDNILSKTISGAGLGLTSGAALPWIKKVLGGELIKSNDSVLKSVCVMTLIGASLGAFIGAVQELSKYKNRKDSGKNRLLESLKNNLHSMGYVLNQDYVLDPVRADRMKTRVSVVISRCSDDLRLVVNMFDDPKLKAASKEIINGLPKTAHITEKAMNKYNELSISTFSQQGGDAGFIARVIEMFIKRGFPVYITEVG